MNLTPAVEQIVGGGTLPPGATGFATLSEDQQCAEMGGVLDPVTGVCSAPDTGGGGWEPDYGPYDDPSTVPPPSRLSLDVTFDANGVAWFTSESADIIWSKLEGLVIPTEVHVNQEMIQELSLFLGKSIPCTEMVEGETRVGVSGNKPRTFVDTMLKAGRAVLGSRTNPSEGLVAVPNDVACLQAVASEDGMGAVLASPSKGPPGAATGPGMSKTTKYALIAGGVLLAGGFGYVLLRKK